MLKTVLELLGLCDHDWLHVSDIITSAEPMEVLMCRKCWKFRYIPFSERSGNP